MWGVDTHVSFCVQGPPHSSPRRRYHGVESPCAHHGALGTPLWLLLSCHLAVVSPVAPRHQLQFLSICAVGETVEEYSESLPSGHRIALPHLGFFANHPRVAAGTGASYASLMLAFVAFYLGGEREVKQLGQHYGLDSVVFSPAITWWWGAMGAMIGWQLWRAGMVVWRRVTASWQTNHGAHKA